VVDRELERRNDVVRAEHKAAVARGEKRVLRKTVTGELHSYSGDEIGFTPRYDQPGILRIGQARWRFRGYPLNDLNGRLPPDPEVVRRHAMPCRSGGSSNPPDPSKSARVTDAGHKRVTKEAHSKIGSRNLPQQIRSGGPAGFSGLMNRLDLVSGSQRSPSFLSQQSPQEAVPQTLDAKPKLHHVIEQVRT
jgi:hypothetical protein